MMLLRPDRARGALKFFLFIIVCAVSLSLVYTIVAGSSHACVFCGRRRNDDYYYITIRDAIIIFISVRV